MRAEHWQQLFREKGWLQGEKIIAHLGHKIVVELVGASRNLLVYSEHGKPSETLDATHAFLILNQSNYYLWEDITHVRIWTV